MEVELLEQHGAVRSWLKC